MKITKELELGIPTIPNFLTVTGESGIEKISIAQLTESQLNKVGCEWTKALKERAKVVRSQPTGPTLREGGE